MKTFDVSSDDLRDEFRAIRRRTRSLFDLVTPEGYLSRPIPLRHPIVFYEGHLPAFGVNTLVKKTLRQRGVDENLEILFARGIDPEDEKTAGTVTAWPDRSEVQRYGEEAGALIDRALAASDLANPLHRQAAFTVIEHELMHQETLMYILHQLPYEQKRRPRDLQSGSRSTSLARSPEAVVVPPGLATLGALPGEISFGWDNEFPVARVDVADFEIDRFSVTNSDFLPFVDAGGYREKTFWSDEGWKFLQKQGQRHPFFWLHRDGVWYWRGMFELIPLPPAWPVYVTQVEAEAFARWKKRRLMTEPEFHRAAFGSPDGERPLPWNTDEGSGEGAERGNFDFQHWDPVDAGSHPAGQSAWGVHDLIGNGWEWTSTPFEPFPGFEPMASYPEYSADFFDGKHAVMKGASPVTPGRLVRRSFRNWFRRSYPYVYAKFRTLA